jgi:uncharacterized paraquat-inducible protein A
VTPARLPSAGTNIAADTDLGGARALPVAGAVMLLLLGMAMLATRSARREAAATAWQRLARQVRPSANVHAGRCRRCGAVLTHRQLFCTDCGAALYQFTRRLD